MSHPHSLPQHRLAPRRRSRRQRGVTLVEVLIVVAILGLISGGVAFAVLPQFAKTQVNAAKLSMEELLNVTSTYKTDHPADCPKVDDLKAEKLLRGDKNTNDPWGKPFKIVCSGSDIGIGSNGPDGRENTEDDIWVGVKPK